MDAKKLAIALRNIGSVLAGQLVAVGIDTPGKLRKIGAIAAYKRIFIENNLGCGKFNAAYLYALEGAIIDCDWRDIPEVKKQKFKQLTATLRQKKCQV